MKSILNTKNSKSGIKGTVLVDVILFGALIVFVILPLVSLVLEWQIVVIKVQSIQDAVDLATLSTFGALENVSYGKDGLNLNYDRLREDYMKTLSDNLRLDAGMNPEDNSVLGGRVIIEELEIYSDNLPVNCSGGTLLTMPSVHTIIIFSIKPSLYGAALLELSGREYFDFRVHIDSEMPVNN